MKGIILSGGKGTRLFPITKGISKQLLPVYDKPMIYYPLSVLMLSGINEILIISNPEFIDNYKMLFGNGQEIGLDIKYKVQLEPRGLADAFIVGEEFIGKDTCSLILGDNIFYGQGLSKKVQNASKIKNGATIFGYYVKDPKSYGVVEFDDNNKVVSLEEKPRKPKSHYAVPGLYFYDKKVVEMAKNLKPSSRGEIEITDLNNEYLKNDQLNVELLGRGYAWLDTGTHDSLLEASNFIETIQKRQGYYIGCIEEIAYKMGYIDNKQLLSLSDKMISTEYGKYLKYVARGEGFNGEF